MVQIGIFHVCVVAGRSLMVETGNDFRLDRRERCVYKTDELFIMKVGRVSLFCYFCLAAKYRLTMTVTPEWAVNHKNGLTNVE